MSQLQTDALSDDNQVREDPDDEPNRIDRVRSVVMRTGWVVCTVGLIVTLIGARQRMLSGEAAEARVLHSVGLFVLLVGFAITLLALRARWISSCFSGPGLRDQEAQDGVPVVDSAPVMYPHTPWLRGLLLTSIIWIGCWLVSLCLIVLAPAVLSGLYMALVSLLLIGSCAVVIASGTPLQRAFCIGAIIPLIQNAYRMSAMSFVLMASTGVGRTMVLDEGVPRALWQQLISTLDAFGQYGEMTRVVVLAAWLAALLSGSVTLLVRVLLSRINAA